MKILKTALALLLALMMVQCKDDPAPAPTPDIELTLPQSVFNVDKGTSQVEILVNCSAPMSQWKIDPGQNRWIQYSRTDYATGVKRVVVTCQANTQSSTRTAELRFITADGSKELAKATITQDGDFSPPVDEDKKVNPTTARCTDYQPGAEIALSYDGNMETMYHSKWSGTTFPVNIEYFFDGKNPIDYLIYYPRTSGSNGYFGAVSIYVATDAAKTYELLGDYDFGMKGSPTMIEIPGNKKATAIKFSVKSGNGGFASCAEMEFYSRTVGGAIETSLLKVFTDLTLTELKAGVTDADIKALPDFYQKTANLLKNNNYDPYEKEFRIREYKPYSMNEAWASKLMTKTYSNLDNPTGISVKAGEEVVVCVGDTHGQAVSIQSIWEETSGDHVQTQASGINYMLKPGINKLVMKEQGQLFVMYNTDITNPDAKPIKIHILPGSATVTGFFDINEHKTDEKYAELLKKATHKYFCVRGNRIMFYFHRQKMTAKIVSAINLWDDFIGWQQELMGLDKYRPTQFNNHIFAISPEGSYMWASSYRVAFVYTYLNNILLKENVMAAEDNAWGPAHEIGHVNQLAINWASGSESSNNLFSNYTIYKLGKYKSRGRGLISLATARFVDGQQWYNMGDATHMNEDTETHMRMNWQLWNYFHRCNIKPDFWPTLFELMRELGLNETSDCGRKQIEFAKRASKAANADLTDFFELWGFFEEVDSQIEQYGTYKYKVTAAMIKEAKQYMSQFPKPKHAFEYIEDRKYTDFSSSDRRYQEVGNLGFYQTYIDNPELASNISATVKDRSVTINNGTAAVAIEIRRGATTNDELVYFSNFLKFNIPEGVNVSGCSLLAVRANGERKFLHAF